MRYSGTTPKSGAIVVYSAYELEIAIYDGSYCAYKRENEEEVHVDRRSQEECDAILEDVSQTGQLHIEPSVNGTIEIKKNGEVQNESDIIYQSGDQITVRFVPNSGYQLTDYQCDFISGLMKANTEYTKTLYVVKDLTITATFGISEIPSTVGRSIQFDKIGDTSGRILSAPGGVVLDPTGPAYNNYYAPIDMTSKSQLVVSIIKLNGASGESFGIMKNAPTSRSEQSANYVRSIPITTGEHIIDVQDLDGVYYLNYYNYGSLHQGIVITDIYWY